MTEKSVIFLNIMNPIIEFNNFSFKYYSQKNPTLKKINLKINSGEKILILGLSGSGKSTLGNCINGLIPNVYNGEISGSCIIDGKDISKTSISELSKSVGTVLQDTDGQFVGLTVAEDIAFAMENDCVDQAIMFKKVDDIANKLDINNLLSKAPSELSGGQKQRVSLAGVMVDDIKILLFDEPLANLDPASGKNTIELIDEISKNKKTTIIIIEHRLEDVLHRHVDRIVLFDDGEIIYNGNPNELLASDLLINIGIREPLYLSALKYAGIKLTNDDNPAYIEDIKINNENKKKLIKWVKENKDSREFDRDVLLSLENLVFSYDGVKNNIDDVSFDVYDKEMLAIIGKNGAGKSTISKLLAGFINLDGGRILLNNRDLIDDTIFERGKRIGLVLQNPNQMICNTMIYDEVAYGLRNMKLNEEEVESRVLEALKVCGLLPFKKWPISALSYGQKKRVTIASIIVMKPDVIVLDEPTAGQDYKHYTEIMKFLKELNNQGNTLIIITHDMHLMLEYCDRAVVILDGKKIYEGNCPGALNDEDIISKANLKKTSLFDLAEDIGVEPIDLTVSYINEERKSN